MGLCEMDRAHPPLEYPPLRYLAFAKDGDLSMTVGCDLRAEVTQVCHYKGGRFIKRLPLEGTALKSVISCCVFNSLIYALTKDVYPLLNGRNDSVLVFDIEGRLVQTIPRNGLCKRSLVAVSSQFIVIISGIWCTVSSLDGEVLHNWAIRFKATHLVVHNNSIYAADSDHNIIYAFSREGVVEKKSELKSKFPQLVKGTRGYRGYIDAFFVYGFSAKSVYFLVNYQYGFEVFDVNGKSKNVYSHDAGVPPGVVHKYNGVIREFIVEKGFLYTFNPAKLKLQCWSIKTEVF